MIKKTIIALFLLLPVLCFAQRGGGRNISPDSMAISQTQNMKDSLVLSSAQVDKIHAVNLDFAKRFKALRGEYQGDRENMRSAMQALRKEQMAAWDKYLTDDQLARWQIIQQERRVQRRGNRPGGKRKKESAGTNEKT